MPARKTASHRDGAGEIRIVIGVAGGDIEEKQIAFAAGLRIFQIMQHTGILAAGDDRRVGKLAALPQEFVGELGFDFHFIDARPNKTAHAPEPGFRDRARLAQQRQLALRFHGPQPMHDPREPLIIMQRIGFLHLGDEPGFARLHDNRGALMLVGIQIDVLALTHQPMKQRAKRGQPLHAFDPREPLRFLFAELVAFPRFQFRIGFA